MLVVLLTLIAEDTLVEGVEPAMETSESFREEKTFLDFNKWGSMSLSSKVWLEPYASGCSL